MSEHQNRLSAYEQEYLDCLERRRAELEELLHRSGFSREVAMAGAQDAIIQAAKLIEARAVETLEDRWKWLPLDLCNPPLPEELAGASYWGLLIDPQYGGKGYRGEMQCIIAKIFGSVAMTGEKLFITNVIPGRSFLKGHIFGDNVSDFLALRLSEGEGEVLVLGCFNSPVKELGRTNALGSEALTSQAFAASTKAPAHRMPELGRASCSFSLCVGRVPVQAPVPDDQQPQHADRAVQRLWPDVHNPILYLALYRIQSCRRARTRTRLCERRLRWKRTPRIK
jgi:hypothetical protein